MQTLAISLAWLTLIACCVAMTRVLWGLSQIAKLASLVPCSNEEAVSLSIIVPARNEQLDIEEAVRSLLQQDYPAFELIVVDDRSTDRTPEILRRLSKEDSRLKVVRIDTLPAGWLGKNHALHVASQQVASEFVLFTDADIVYQPQALRQAISMVRMHQLDHLAVVPEVVMPNALLKSFAVTFSIFFLQYFRPWAARNSASNAYIGIGAFNLIRTNVLGHVGGLEKLRMRPDDDVKLGRVIKMAGFRQDVAIGTDTIGVRWYRSLREVIRGLEKNAFSGVDYRISVTVVSSLMALTLNVWPFVAVLVTAGDVQLINGLVGLLMVTFVTWTSWQMKSGWWSGLLFPVTVSIFVYIQWRTMLLTLWRGGISWRDTFYSLDELKRNVV